MKRLFSVLIEENFSNFLKYIKANIDSQTEFNQKEYETAPSKRIKLSSTENVSEFVENLEITEWISKFDKKTNENINSDSSVISNISLKWNYNTLKCVDASPLLILKEEREFILIGSHSSKFVCVDDKGTLIWEYEAKDRIESSATISRCKNFVIFGI